jgi:exosortase
MAQQLSAVNRAAVMPYVALGASLVALIWAHWSSLVDVAGCWAHDPQYSHGYLVPLFSLALLWLRREMRPRLFQPSWWGAVVIGAGIGLRLFGTYFYFIWLEQISLLPILAGLCLLAGGWQAFRWSWPAIAFLGFMIPLPYWLSVKLTGPLQQLATVVCTFLLQTLGIPAIAEGNVIQLSEVEIGIVEACSGLRMLVIFFALSTAVALVVRRPLWEKIVVALSALPIALVSNVVRITVTGILHELVSSDFANKVFHDLAGWLMMPLALGMLWLELTLIHHLWLEAPQSLRRGVRPSPIRPRPLAPPRRPRPGLAA